MHRVLDRKSNTISIATFWENYQLDKYNFEPPYQRYSVWDEEKQSYFIDSILKNFPIPPIFLHEHIDTDSGKTKYDVIDGKQRLTSIVRFINNEIPVSNEFELEGEDEVSGKYFKDFSDESLLEYKSLFWKYLVPIEYVDTSSERLIDEVFDRLNRNGERLTGQELRNAKYHGSILLKFVHKMSDYLFWKIRLEHVDLSRMENHEFVSELFFAQMKDEPLEALPNIIDDYYEEFSNADIDWAAAKEEFLNITGFMESLGLDYDGYRIKGVSHLYGLWCFSMYCLRNNIQAKTISEPLNNMFVDLRNNNFQSKSVDEYKKTMSSNTKSKLQRKRRVEALKAYCGI